MDTSCVSSIIVSKQRNTIPMFLECRVRQCPEAIAIGTKETLRHNKTVFLWEGVVLYS